MVGGWYLGDVQVLGYSLAVTMHQTFRLCSKTSVCMHLAAKGVLGGFGLYYFSQFILLSPRK